MGLFFSRLYDALASFSSETSSRILMLGLDAAGKTTILYKVKLDETVRTIPTIGFNVETVTPAPGINFTVWDIGGQHQIRSLYAHYYDKTDGLLFVVDSADRDRIQEARDELFGIINHSHMLSIPIVVLANKMDLPTAMKPSELIEQLNLHSISRQRWFVQSACALTGDGIIEGMQQLSNMIKDRKKSTS